MSFRLTQTRLIQMSGRIGKSSIYLVGWSGLGYVLYLTVPNGGSIANQQEMNPVESHESQNMKKLFRGKSQ